MTTTLVKGGLVLDGSGSDGRIADVRIDGDVVTAIGTNLDVTDGAEIIDAAGCWVTPGFIDLHTHYDAELEFDPSLSESVRHGVTTVMIGSCGLSFAIGEPDDLADMFCRVEGVPRSDVLPMLNKVKDWDTPAEYLDHISQLPLGPNVCSMLGHSAMRANVMGLGRSLDDDVEPTAAELGRMIVMLDEALDAGYLGLSINTLPWDKMDGDRFRSRPTPSVFATWKEYRRLGAVLRERDAVFEGVPDISGRWNLLLFAAMASGIGRKPLRTTIISMMDVPAAPGAYKIVGATFAAARKWFNADVRLQALPQPFRLWTDGMENPVLEEIGAGTEALHLAEQAARSELLRDPAYRKRFKKQWLNKIKSRAYHRDLAEARIVDCPDAALVGKSFAEAAALRGTDRVDTFLDLAAEYGNDLRWETTAGNGDEEAVAWIVEHPQAQIGFSDAGAHLRNMAFYNFPIRLLALVRRRQAAGQHILPLGQAVHRVTAELADFLGIDAGRISVGGRADLVVIDPTLLDDRVADVVEEPMPGIDSVHRLVNRGDDAVKAVVIAGKVAWDDQGRAAGLGTEADYGRLLRNTRS